LGDQLDDSIIKIDNQRVHIEQFEEACSDMANDTFQSNRYKGTKIPQRFITKLDHTTRDSNIIDTSISANLRLLQDICFGFVPEPAHKEEGCIVRTWVEVLGNCGANHTRGVIKKEGSCVGN
jgi:hypothetical protein